MDKKKDFQIWLEKRKSLSNSSCEKYASAIDKISKDLINNGNLQYSLFDISNPMELNNLSTIYWTENMIR